MNKSIDERVKDIIEHFDSLGSENWRKTIEVIRRHLEEAVAEAREDERDLVMGEVTWNTEFGNGVGELTIEFDAYQPSFKEGDKVEIRSVEEKP